MASERDVAEWMAGEIRIKSYLIQEQAFFEIQERFGEQFAYLNANGGNAISPGVLKQFNKLTKDCVVWSKGERMWRTRSISDQPGRKQD